MARRLDAEWLVFENVPGLLSSGKPKGEDFATLISAFTGYEYRPPVSGWQKAGIAEGRADRWGIAWRILDAQYFGVAPRRRRVFVVGYRGDWRPAAAVLLEPESMRGDSPPSRKKTTPVAALTANGVGTCGADDNQAQAGHLFPHGFGGGNCSGPIEVAACLTAKGVRQDFEVETFIAHSQTLAPSLTRNYYGDHEAREGLLVSHTLRGEGFDASEDGTGRGTPLIPVAFDTTQITSQGNRSNPQHGDPCHTLSSNAHAPAIAYPILEPGSRTGVSTTDVRAGIGIGADGDPMFTLQAGKTHGIAVSLRGRDGGGTAELSGDEQTLSSIETVLRELHEKDLPNHPYGTQTEFNLLIAFQSYDGGGLFTTSGSLVTRVEFFEVIGSGAVTKFFAHMMYRKTRWDTPILKMSEGTILSAYLIHLAKGQLSSIGGKSQLITLDWDGNIRFASDWEVPSWEQFFSDYQWQSNQVMLDCADPTSSEEDFNARLDGQVIALKAIKKSLSAKRQQWDEVWKKIADAGGLLIGHTPMPSAFRNSED